MKFSDRGKMFPWYILALGFVSGAIGYASDRDRSTSDEHYFRHQQHYNQRIEQAVNDFKLAQSHRNASHHRQVVLRHQHHDQKQLQLEEEPVPIASASAPPNGRHGHHLRHYNRHHQTWEQRVFPSLRHQITTTIAPSPEQQEEEQLKSENLHDRRSGDRVNLTGTMQSRLFDRDGLNTVSTASNGLSLKSKDSHKTRSSSSLDRDEDHNRLVETMAKGNRDNEGTEEKLDDYYDDDEDSLEDDEDDVEDDDDNDDDNDDDDDTDEDRGDNKNDNEYLENDDSRNRINNDRVSSKLRSNNLESTSGVLSKAYIPGTLTRHKYETLGTHEAVKQSRKIHNMKEQHLQALMRDHVIKVNNEASCKWPKPKVEKIQRDTSKLYIPHCTILHRCGDDTSCCSSDQKTCVVKRAQKVDLFFHVKGIGSKKGVIEQLTFINHTECHCVDKSKYHVQTAPALMRRATIFDCNCPRLFEKLLQENGTCRCDCSSGNIGCDWLKRGMEHFSMSDRKCIIEGRCKYPTCEYGNYVQKHGRCPKKEDKLAFSRSFH